MTEAGAAGGAVGHGLLDDVLDEAVRRTGAYAVGIYALAPDEPVLEIMVMCGMPGDFIKPWRRVSLAAPLPVADAVNEQRLVWVSCQEDLARMYPRTALATPYQFALAAAPLTTTRHRWGAMLLLWPPTHSGRLTEQEEERIVGCCRRAADLLENASHASGRPLAPPDQLRVLPTESSRQARAEGTPAAADFAERLPGGCCALDLDGRVTFVTGTAARLLGRGAEQLRGTLLWRELSWLNDPLYEDRYRAAVFSRQPASFQACRPPDRWLDFSLYPDDSGISVRIAPAGPGPRPRPATPAPKPRGAPTPMKPGQLYEVMHLAAGLTEVVGVQDLVDLIAGQILPAFGADGLVLFAADAGHLRVTGHRGYTEQDIERVDGQPLNNTSAPIGETFVFGNPLFFTDHEEMERRYPAPVPVTGKEGRAFLPLTISGRPVGCCVISYADPHHFSTEERAVLSSLAGLIAQALDRAQLYDTKHRLAHDLQQALLPHTLPSIPGLEVAARYLPSTRGMDIGGDFYDLIHLGDARCAAVIGDVQGHNADAAALMGQVRTAVQAYATAGTPPDQVLTRTNRLLTDLDPGLFTSCLYVHLDLGRRRALLVNAGHPPPLLRDPVLGTHVLHVPPGLVLGVDRDVTYPVTEIDLRPGALLALYTDGLVEVPGTDIDDSTADLARALATAEGTPDRITRTLLDHARPPGRRSDDIAVLLLRAT
ncbi:SpoIIE family protein phosphatase [Streptomyces sp. SID4948]|nr:SpoIIE family protein phosphatase [Streptomyces sp. DvalAA-14]MYS19901.1 SpoIIE family protein phosphatase [Streptomyces sp. SID4948]